MGFQTPQKFVEPNSTLTNTTNLFGQNILWAHILDSLALYSPLISIMDNGQRVSKMCAHRHIKMATFKRIIYRQKREGVKNVPSLPRLRKDINFVHPKPEPDLQIFVVVVETSLRTDAVSTFLTPSLTIL